MAWPDDREDINSFALNGEYFFVNGSIPVVQY